MRNIFFLILISNFFSCSTAKTSKEVEISTAKLSETEKTIVNDFLISELKKDNYKRYADFQINVIAESIKQSKPISDYAFNYQHKKSWGVAVNEWVIDSVSLNKLKLQKQFDSVYLWKSTDFYCVDVKILKTEAFNQIIKKGAFGLNETKYLIVALSRPVIIDSSHALLSFDIGNGQLGNAAITHFTVLMKKVNEQWMTEHYFEDGIYY
ncbi:hypothetical protein [Flavobacterium sp. N1719]|uniref:hypothetical protein n=1 Tax=Flavobacterium sp. N1719 TaxID=2885633 RepID=UPI002221C968|nr:hypothetical protein [Flavobacterium sp. N1719]